MIVRDTDGLFWPEQDTIGRPIIKREAAATLPLLLAHEPRRGVCVQAGGNVGYWPRLLAEHFRAVYTFEPNWLPFQCLIRNVQENVHAFRAGLGLQTGGAGISFEPCNFGGANLSSVGDIRVIPLDAFQLDELDLLCLDIEGFELHALMGAKNTIAACKPTISVEFRGLAKRYDPRVTDDVIRNWLSGIGYERKASVEFDEIWQPKSQS